MVFASHWHESETHMSTEQFWNQPSSQKLPVPSSVGASSLAPSWVACICADMCLWGANTFRLKHACQDHRSHTSVNSLGDLGFVLEWSRMPRTWHLRFKNKFEEKILMVLTLTSVQNLIWMSSPTTVTFKTCLLTHRRSPRTCVYTSTGPFLVLS